tara:strand:+ start:186 stop:590 length:405 start_codon:yes stop_codon:yes gene_type:complete
MIARNITNILIFFLSIFAILTVASFYFDVYVIFPFTLVGSNEIPYENLVAIRLAVFATFSFYGVMHILHGSKEVYPIHFLKTFLFMLSIMAISVYLKTDVDISLKQWLILSFFFCAAIILHISTASKIKRFSKK